MLKLAVLTVLIAACYAATPIQISPVFPIRAVSIINGMSMTPEAAKQSLNAADPDMQIPGITFIAGHIVFVQKGVNEPVTVKMNIKLTPPTMGKVLRGLHIHSFGLVVGSDNVTEVCDSTGPHYNPEKTTHGSLSSTVRHPGDFGNVETINGEILEEIIVPGLKLYGDETIIGRSVVLHERVDDGGLGTVPASKLNGNAGPRIACGDIVFDKTV